MGVTSEKISRAKELKANGTFFSVKDQAKPVFFQPKLTIGPVDDVYEREADAAADKVMRMSVSENIKTTTSSVTIQPKCASCNDEEELQRKEDGSVDEQSETSSIAADALGSGGDPLDNHSRSFMESRFGYNFSGVKIHTGADAVQMSRDLHARAFTVGNDIYFNEGQYRPDAQGGQHLLAHELTHTIQQKQSGNRISMARFNIGTLPVNVNYDDVVYHDNIREYESELERRYQAWTGVPIGNLHDLIVPLTNREKRWLLFAVDVLADNSSLSAAGRPGVFFRLLGHLPTLIFDPLSGGNSFDFPFEVMVASGLIDGLPPTALRPRQTQIKRLMQLRSGMMVEQQQFTDSILSRIQEREMQNFITRARQDAAAASPSNIIAQHALPHIQRAVRIVQTGQTIRLDASFELAYEGTTEADGRTRSVADIPRIRQAILNAWTVRFTTGPYINLTFILNPLLTFRHISTTPNANAWQIKVRQPDTGPSATTYWLGEISLAAVHLQDARIVAVAHEVYHLFGPFDTYSMPIEGYAGTQIVSVGRHDARNRPDLIGLIDPVVLARWRASGYITAAEEQRQTHTTAVIWEEEAQQILQTLNVQPPRRSPEEREIEEETESQNIGGYTLEQQEERLRRIRQSTQFANNSIRWLEQTEEAITLERALGVGH